MRTQCIAQGIAQYFIITFKEKGFTGGSAGKESTCNAGDLGSIPGFGKCPGEEKGYPLQYSCTSLVAQLLKNLPAMQETWVRSLGWKDPLEKGKATHSSILPWRIPWTVQSMGSQRVGQDWITFTFMAFFMVNPHICIWLLEKPKLWPYRPFLAK